MEQKIRQILSPNKNPNRFFAIDYFTTLYEGSSKVYQYFGSLMDYNTVYNTNEIVLKNGALEAFEEDVKSIQEGSIIGFYCNPDPYQENENDFSPMRQALMIIQKYHMGVYIETVSDFIMNDTDILDEIAKSQPVIITIPLSFSNDVLIRQFEGEKVSTYEERLRLLKKLHGHDYHIGVLLKPVIPFINDSVEGLSHLLDMLFKAEVEFIYPSFVISVSEKQRKALFELIDQYYPVLKNLYMDRFGSKKTWASPEGQALKKAFVFACKKQKIKYGMSDIVHTIKPDTFEQFRLF